MRRVLSWLAFATCLFGLWLAFVGTVAWLELVAGACAVAVGAAALEAVRSQGLLRYRVEPHLAARAWRFVYLIPFELGIVRLALARSLVRGRLVHGGFRAIPFPARARDAATSAGRRAFVAAAATLAPNTIVVDVDEERKLALVHYLDERHARGDLL
jgi:multisubunit Na+/H+ antiporter MnhE subunit